METLRYGTGKLVTAMICSAIGAALFLYGLLYPEDFEHIRKLRWLASDLGHYVISPALVLLCLIVAWRAALIAVGDRKAVEATADHLVITTWWTTQRIRWSEIADVSISSYGSGRAKSWQLVVLRCSGGLFGTSKVRLSLSTTELHRNRYQDFAETLSALVARRGRPAAGGPAPAVRGAEPEQPAGGSDFDADAALARYMAKKAQGLVEAPGPAGPMARRGGFGRKGL